MIESSCSIAAFGPVVRDEIAVEEDVDDDVHDRGHDDRDDGPHDRVAELAGLLAQHAELGRDATEVRLQLLGDVRALWLVLHANVVAASSISSRRTVVIA